MMEPFEQLPSLKELSISCFYRIEVIGPEFCSNDSSHVSFRSLEILKFEGEGLPCLKELSIRRCPGLRRSLP